MIIFIISLLLVFCMWEIQKLSQYYSSYFNYYIIINTNVPGYSQNSTSDDVLVVRGRASGFYILKQNYTSINNKIIELDIDPRLVHKINSFPDKFYINSQDIKNRVQEYIGDDLQLEGFITDTLFFRLNEQMFKKVPVYANSLLNYKQQYMPFTPIQLKPDSVLIYGNAKNIEYIDSVSTVLITGNKLSSNINGVIKIKNYDGVEISIKEVYYYQEIGRYVEESIPLNINIINAPTGAKIATYPSEVKVNCRIKFEKIDKNFLSEFYAVVDYRDLEKNGSRTLKVNLYKQPKNIFDLNINPPFVEIIEK